MCMRFSQAIYMLQVSFTIMFVRCDVSQTHVIQNIVLRLQLRF